MVIQTEMIFLAKSVESHNWNSFSCLLPSLYFRGRKWNISNCAGSSHSVTYWKDPLRVLWRSSESLTVHVWPVIFPLSFYCGCLESLVGLVGSFYLNCVQLPSCKAVFYDPLLNIVEVLKKHCDNWKKLIAEKAHQDFLGICVCFPCIRLCILEMLCNTNI